jgi:hypothetical protein
LSSGLVFDPFSRCPAARVAFDHRCPTCLVLHGVADEAQGDRPHRCEVHAGGRVFGEVPELKSAGGVLPRSHQSPSRAATCPPTAAASARGGKAAPKSSAAVRPRPRQTGGDATPASSRTVAAASPRSPPRIKPCGRSPSMLGVPDDQRHAEHLGTQHGAISPAEPQRVARRPHHDNRRVPAERRGPEAVPSAGQPSSRSR